MSVAMSGWLRSCRASGVVLRALTSRAADARRVECRHILMSNREDIEMAAARLESGEGFAGSCLSTGLLAVCTIHVNDCSHQCSAASHGTVP
jgi:hypothetical protein